MILNTTTYFSFALIILLIIVLFIFILRYRRINKEKNDAITDISFKFEITVNELKNEIKRQNFVISDYQGKIFNKQGSEPVKQIEKSVNETEVNINDVIFEKNQLEKEKQQFKDKTKKLWEQSIAIHKEKERIDGLKKQIEKTHQQVTDSIKYAKYIQNALLPLNSYLEEILPEHFILFKPRDIVSGDFYWMKQIENKLIVVAADCTGHGVPGAFMSMLGISSLNEIVLNSEDLNPADILEKLRTIIIKSLHQEDISLNSRDGMDAAICVFDKDNNELQYSGAFNPLYHISKNELTEIKATNCPVAYYLKMKPFENHLIKIQKDDYIYIFSDGYNDQFGGKDGQKFKSRNFKSLLIEISNAENNMLEICNKLEENIENWKTDKYPQVDDILIVGLRF
jgi:serine phosphatase RsbU (regulator of sigma subunit)